MKAAVTKRFVADASVTLAWCFADEATSFTEAVLDLLSREAEAIVPPIWPFEVANALLMCERRKRVTNSQTASLLRRIADLPISIDPVQAGIAFGGILSLARSAQLTECDASYLELAQREGLPLATLDEGLRRAARSVGVSLLKV